MAKVVTLTTNEIESKVLHEPGPFALDFYQASCAPCRILAPRLERVAQAYAGQLPVYRVDIDRDLWVAQRFGVMSIPTVISPSKRSTSLPALTISKEVDLRAAFDRAIRA